MTKHSNILFAVLCAVGFPVAAQRFSTAELGVQLEGASKQVQTARSDLDLVEKQYTLRAELSDDAVRLQRFSDGEIQYLLGDFHTASVLFYDLVANKDFQSSSRYADALFYLSDSLYQEKNYLGARVYLRQLLALKGARYKEALSRYLEIAGRMNEFVGIEEYITQAKSVGGGQLSPELNYVYAKWIFNRQDVPVEARIPRAQEIFANLARDLSGPVRAQAGYFVGVGHVKLKAWDKAIEQFKAVRSLPARDSRERDVKELADLSLGRVYFEVGKYDDAIDAYARIPQQSDSFPDSLYEIAWAYVRKGELQKARNATEVLLLVAEDSVLAPEAQILQGTLLQKLAKYEEALDTYNSVINTYAPVRDEIDALLAVNKDPVQYFDELLARNEKTLDVTKLLPAAALKWASTRQEVSEAVGITSALDDGRNGIAEAKLIADRILKTLDERGLESFPVLQEGFTRADAVDTSLTRVEDSVTRIEGQLANDSLNAEQKQRLASIETRKVELKKRIDTLPTTAEQVQARQDRIQKKIDELDKVAFQLGIELQSQAAQLLAVRKYADDTRAQRPNKPDDEKAFVERLTNEQRGLEATVLEVDEFRAKLRDERANADKAVGGEVQLRKEYEAVLDEQRQVYGELRNSLPQEARRLAEKADSIRGEAQALRSRVDGAKKVIRERVAAKAQKLREQVIAEQQLISGYNSETEAASGETRQLVGRIAYQSFRRVQKSFYDLVLKADVGVVDVSFQRKQDKTQQIQKLASQKDRELKQLDDEFKEVLKDVD
jgi:tetratricopeptide (TPR) repeat protein